MSASEETFKPSLPYSEGAVASFVYPDSGETGHVGDAIWWDDGACVGYVYKVLISPEEWKAYGLEEPHLLIRINDPAGEEKNVQFSGCSLRQLSELGVWKMTEADLAEVEKVRAKARLHLGLGGEIRTCVRSPILAMRSNAWHLIFETHPFQECFVDADTYEVTT